MNSKNQWFDDRTPKQRILSRPAVEVLDERTLLEFLRESMAAMNRGDLEYFMSVVALDMTCQYPGLVNGQVGIVDLNRDAYLIGLATSFDAKETGQYSMEETSIDRLDSDYAEVTLSIRSPDSQAFVNSYGTEVTERVTITLLEGRPVFKRIEVLL